MPASQFRSRRIPQFLLCTLLIAGALLMPSMLFGQAYFGTVSGVLTDSTDAVVAGAKVIAPISKRATPLRRPPTTADDIVPVGSAGDVRRCRSKPRLRQKAEPTAQGRHQ